MKRKTKIYKTCHPCYTSFSHVHCSQLRWLIQAADIMGTW